MFREILESYDAVIALASEGKLSQEDLKRRRSLRRRCHRCFAPH